MDTTRKNFQEKELDNKWQCVVPDELLGLVLSHLFAGDKVMFHAVCKSWRSISVTPPSPLPFPNFHQGTWLLYFPGSSNVRCNLYHPIRNVTFHLDVPDEELYDSKIRCAKYGWLLLSNNDEFGFQHSFLFNPLTKARHDLPKSHIVQVMSFTSIPYSSNFLVVAVGPEYVEIYKLGDEDWKRYEYVPSLPSFFPMNCNSVLYKGLYYCLSLQGNLLVFDAENIEENLIVYEKPLAVKVRNSIQQAFLVENEGELVAVLVTKNRKTVHVLKWDDMQKIFIPMESLGNNMLFISYAASFSEKAVVRGTGNKIYFPNMFNGTSAFYSLTTRKYHTFSNDFSKDNSSHLDQLQNCTWFNAGS